MSAGYVRVIVTVNFDRLIEQALAELGVQPVVIATADAARGAIMLVHSPATVIKVNGDYLDPHFRNTEAELEQYETSLACFH